MHTLGHTDTHMGAHTQTHTRTCTLRPDECVSERRRLPAAWGNNPRATCTRHPQGRRQVTPWFHTHPLFFAGVGGFLSLWKGISEMLMDVSGKQDLLNAIPVSIQMHPSF